MSGKRPVYARVLRLRYLRPGGLLCFLFFEGAIALGVLLSLAELAPWWGIFVLPIAVAAMVKLNDVVAASHARVRPVTAHVRPRSGRPGPSGQPPLRASVPHARRADTPPPTPPVRTTGAPVRPPTGTGGRSTTTQNDTRGDHRRGPNNHGRFE
jgi:hypothetical protein